MSYASSVADAKDALVTVLGARGGLSGVPVLREYPKDPADIKTSTGTVEAIWVGREGDQDVTGTAMIPVFKSVPVIFDETYVLWLTVQVFKNTSGGTQESASERAWTLAAEVIGAVATDPKLGLTNNSARSMFHVGLDGDAYEFAEKTGRLDQGYGCQIQIGLHCTARITLS